MKPLIFYITFLLVIFAIVPSHVMGSEYSYSFVHLSDIQNLQYKPIAFEKTFSEIESLKSQYNISAIFITGDLTDEYNGTSGSSEPYQGAQFARYVTAISLTTIPVYEIAGDHDVMTVGNYAAWDRYIPSGSRKHNYSFVFNDFIVYAFGWQLDTDTSLLIPSTKTDMIHVLAGNITKVPLILIHPYFTYETPFAGDRFPIAYDLLDSLPRNAIIMSGHAHNPLQIGYMRQTVYNNLTFIEDLTNPQDWGYFSVGRLYTIRSDGSHITEITVSDLYLYPNFVIYKAIPYNLDLTYNVVPPVTGFSANVTSGTAPLVVATVNVESITISIDSTSAGSGSKVVIPVIVSGASNLGAMDLMVTYDPSILKFSGAEVGSLSTNGMIESNGDSPGVIKIGFVDSRGVTGDGTLMTLTFNVVGKKGATSKITPQVTGVKNANLVDIQTTITRGGVFTVGEGGKSPLSIVTVAGALCCAFMLVIYQSKRMLRKIEK